MSLLMHPRANLNGSGHQNLAESWTARAEALRHLAEVWRRTHPHPRDYSEGEYQIEAQLDAGFEARLDAELERCNDVLTFILQGRFS